MAGRLGSLGGDASCSGLLGGLLNGDFSGTTAGASSRWVSRLSKCDSRLLGFSARLIGGGTGGRPLTSSLFISPERLGGGGEGGPEVAESLGDRRGSRPGVTGLLGGALGILNVRGEEATGVGGALFGSTCSCPFSKLRGVLIPLLLGGECGGSIRTAGGGGGFIGLGLIGVPVV